MVTKKKGLIVVAALVVIAGIIYASRNMKGGNKGENNMYHPVGGAFPQSSSTNMQPDNDTASFSASSGSSCGCNKKRMI